MKIQRPLQPAFILLILIFVLLFGVTVSSDAQEVHALLVLLGNDRDIAESVAKNEEKLTNMLKQLSYHCNVQLTLMYSESAHEGIVSHKTFAKGRSGRATTHEQDIIQSVQIEEWLTNLTPRPEDTVLIYYNGHGGIGAFERHNLLFDPGVSADILDRGILSRALKQTSCRLRMLITDTCSNLSQDLSDDVYAKYAVGVRSKTRSYMQDLFLEHEGFLDITAASPGQVAIGNNDLGGHFTSALLSRGFAAVADTDRDSFLSWREAFETTVAETEKLYAEATFDPEMTADLKNQKTQEPLAHSLPTRVGDGGGGTPMQPPPPARSVAILHFTSVPSGAKVLIDGFIVGQTPLMDYELETDGRSEREIEVTVQAEGYESTVEKFRVRRGKPFPWRFELTKKEIPRTFTGKDGGEMFLIPAGEFQMGSNDSEADDDEKPVHTVYIDAFYMDKYEVTNAQYKGFIRANPEWGKDRINRSFHDGDYLKYWNGNDYPSGEANHPVVYVSWYAAMAYAKWAGKRLPTEAEWEYAARGGLSGKKYPWGNNLDSSKANYGRNVGTTTAVGKYSPNGYGLYDMAGNVWEWCLDEYDWNFYQNSRRRNPIAGASSVDWVINNITNVKTRRVLRGGSWPYYPVLLRVANRNWGGPTDAFDDYGFRCARAQ